MTVIRCNNCGNNLNQVYYNTHERTKKGNVATKHHLSNLYYCDKEDVVYHREMNRFAPVLNPTDTNQKVKSKKIPCLSCEEDKIYLKKIYYDDYIKTKGYVRAFPQHLGGYYCEVEDIIFKRLDNGAYTEVLDVGAVAEVDISAVLKMRRLSELEGLN